MATQIALQIDMVQARKLMEESAGKLFSVEFVKRSDGQMRKMVCRTEVKKKINGGGKVYEDKAHGLFTVYSVQDEGYRSIPLERLITLKIGGKLYKLHPELEEEYNKKNAVVA